MQFVRHNMLHVFNKQRTTWLGREKIYGKDLLDWEILERYAGSAVKSVNRKISRSQYTKSSISSLKCVATTFETTQ